MVPEQRSPEVGEATRTKWVLMLRAWRQYLFCMHYRTPDHPTGLLHGLADCYVEIEILKREIADEICKTRSIFDRKD